MKKSPGCSTAIPGRMKAAPQNAWNVCIFSPLCGTPSALLLCSTKVRIVKPRARLEHGVRASVDGSKVASATGVAALGERSVESLLSCVLQPQPESGSFGGKDTVRVSRLGWGASLLLSTPEHATHWALRAPASPGINRPTRVGHSEVRHGRRRPSARDLPARG